MILANQRWFLPAHSTVIANIRRKKVGKIMAMADDILFISRQDQQD
jgi:hypothetical protein